MWNKLLLSVLWPLVQKAIEKIIEQYGPEFEKAFHAALDWLWWYCKVGNQYLAKATVDDSALLQLFKILNHTVPETPEVPERVKTAADMAGKLDSSLIL
jgi:hypothetical protein